MRIHKLIHSIFLFIIAFALLFCLNVTVYAKDDAVSSNNVSEEVVQTENSYDTDYLFHLFDTTEGLSSFEINAIAQTPDGYIWAGSYSGLYRYNGISFTKVNTETKINNVTALFVDNSGTLWIGTNGQGIAYYNKE